MDTGTIPNCSLYGPPSVKHDFFDIVLLFKYILPHQTTVSNLFGFIIALIQTLDKTEAYEIC